MSNGQVIVLLGNGDGTLVSGSLYDAGSHALASGDLDGDGDTDLAVANYDDDDNVGVRMNHGDGTYSPPVNYPAGDGPCHITAVDLHNDGDLDLATANRGSGFYTNATVSVFLNHGDGTFGLPTYFGGGGTGLTIDDLNGDGVLDLASASGGVAVLLNQSSACPGDVDGDGDVDLSDPAALLAVYGTTCPQYAINWMR